MAISNTMFYRGLIHLNKKILVELNDDLKTSSNEIRINTGKNTMLTYDGGNVYKFIDNFKAMVTIFDKYDVIILWGKIYLIDKSYNTVGWINIKNNKCSINL